MNEERIERGENTLNDYMDGHPDYQDNMLFSQDVLVDLLTDLRHMCARHKIDFYVVIANSQIHFEEENRG